MSLRQSIIAQLDKKKPLIFIDTSSITTAGFLAFGLDRLFYDYNESSVALGYRGVKIDDGNNYIFIDIQSKEWTYSEKMDALRNAHRRLFYNLYLNDEITKQDWLKRTEEIKNAKMTDLVPAIYHKCMSKENCVPE